MILIFTIVSGCSKLQVVPKIEFAGDYPTIKIRGMWHYCFQAAQTEVPMVPQHIQAAFCDCVIDTARRKFNIWEYKDTDKDEIGKAFEGFGVKCREQVIRTNQSPIQTTIL